MFEDGRVLIFLMYWWKLKSVDPRLTSCWQCLNKMIGYIAMGDQLLVLLSSSKCTKKLAFSIQSLVPFKSRNSRWEPSYTHPRRPHTLTLNSWIPFYRSKMLTCSSFLRTMRAVSPNGAMTMTMWSFPTVKYSGNTEWNFPVTTPWSHTRIWMSTARLCLQITEDQRTARIENINCIVCLLVTTSCCDARIKWKNSV